MKREVCEEGINALGRAVRRGVVERGVVGIGGVDSGCVERGMAKLCTHCSMTVARFQDDERTYSNKSSCPTNNTCFNHPM